MHLYSTFVLRMNMLALLDSCCLKRITEIIQFGRRVYICVYYELGLTHTHTHARTLARTHAHTHAHTHTHTHTHTRTHTHTHTHTHTPVFTMRYNAQLE